MIKCKLDNNNEPDKTETTKTANLKQPAKVTKQVNLPDNQEKISTEDSKVEIKKKVDPAKKKTKSPEKAKTETAKVKPPVKKRNLKKRPKIQFEEMTWDFGEITEGDIVEKKFKFTNIGSVPLEIIATSATCGCTRPSFPFLDINPGESNMIGVNYNSVGKEGEQHAEVTIESNAEQKTMVLKLYGTVLPKPKKAKSKDSTAVSSLEILRDSLKAGQ